MDSSRRLEDVLSMQGGEDDVSYAKNSHGPAAALASSKPMLTSAIHSIKLTKGCSSHLKIADLGCAVGDNTFSTVDTVVEVLRHKLTLINGKSDQPEPELEVFFSDLPSNDFNTLFRSLEEKVNSSSQKYFAAGVPGSFYRRLFPKGELHVVVTMSALQWLSQIPEKVMEKGSKTWNKGRVWIQGTEGEVVEAYAEQADKDLVQFLQCRKEEIVEGGVLFMLMGGRPSGLVSQVSDHDSRLKYLFTTLMDQAWQDLVDEGLIEEEKRDGFNIPVYLRNTEEIASAIDRCGGFKIEKMEVLKITDPMNVKHQELMRDPQSYGRAMSNMVQAGLKPIIEAYLGPDLTRKLFDRYAIRAAASNEFIKKFSFYYMIAVSAIRV
uniref:Gibberellic acid methyltransferase n=1 Tax=Sisymbrium irio TaxID=3730 RepID=A0A894TBY0_SISIR|nr:gibberellic acid methyltransferase [Sisymbrium irio]